MTAYRQLTIWDVLDEISVAPPNSSLAPVWDCLDTELQDLSVEAQLETAAVAFNQIADILKSRAVMLLQDVRERNSPDGPIVSTDIFAGLVRTTMQLDLDDLIESPIPQTFRPHGPHQFSNTSSQGDSVVAPVEKEKVLEMLEEVRTVEDVHKLAGDEDVQKWQSAIAYYLGNIQDEISLPQLQRALKMPLVEVWLGLLLGGFTLEQRGDFYNKWDIWVMAE
ncbi:MULTISPECIES: hypothetical protein [unclassified Tolypothrix]|uniref:hypothetical protein n=1 Tax=unclassified Tolypothrix TaxID=2649714 RepID=UPI0005EABA16|nr:MULTISPECIES: hypothetical protein [unclassified Tolypothrix]BAY95520.1 hypothetical protein NIES3275_75770 [Microchaete diplosiphon NIES-3275]EKE96654.1 hypothetical protein FDUTEX481_06487 [Tolypothrix sp. PCC 7601]MBE9087320.1 hypothetical protein [Tolypothrix sp. LEGE 11397]UYD30682.1 hypothetical protein HGR01_37800 [Tolypothrix sp. PCC 7712]UYD38489.1 hypothetical protein HG267_39050 [Tolypothrix sp. PCC 7601]